MDASTDLLSMRGRRVLITGAGAGIGQAMAIRFAEAGADLILLDLDRDGLAQTAAALQNFQRETVQERVDLGSKEQIDAFWADLAGRPPDTLINNAGIYPFQGFHELDERHLERIMRINVESAVWMCQHFLARRRNEGGVIVNVSSIEAVLPFSSGLVAYSTSKAALLGLTRALARDYGRTGFRVNAILPGAISTPGTERLARLAIRRLQLEKVKTGYDFSTRLALGRWGKPDDVARVALFLASDLASYVTGAMIPVDGGFLSS